MACAECLKVLESQKSVTQKCSSSAQQLHSIYIYMYICIYMYIYIYIVYMCIYIYAETTNKQQPEMKQQKQTTILLTF